MAILDIFKKTKKEKQETTKPVKKAETVKKEIKSKKPVETELPKVKKEKIVGESWKVLKSPQITEKATDLTKKNQYIFKIFPKVNKTEVKKAIENLYRVDVVSVKIINVPKKRRRLGKISGWRKGYKKAIVKIKKDQKIEVLPR